MSSSAHYVTIRMLGDAKQLEATLARAGLVAEEESSKIGSAFEKGGEKAGGAFQKLGNAMGNLGLPFSNTVSKFGQDFSKIETRGKKFTSAMSEVGKVSALGFAAGFAAIAVDGIKNFANLQQLMTKLVTTGGESAANIKSDTSGVIGLSSQVDQSTSALAGGLYTINSAGFHGAKGLQVLKPAAEAATAEMADLPTVTNAITSALNAYSLGASSSIPITNQMIAATSRGKMSFQDLAGALPEVLPVAASAKLSFAQVTGALATLTAQGMSAQQGAQDLSNTIRSLQNPNQVAISTMEQLGLNSNDVAKNLGKNGLTGTLSQLSQTILQHMGPSGEVLMGAFKQSQAASGDLQIMLNNMTPSVRNLANEFMSGKMTMTQFRKALPTNEQGIIGQFSTLYNKVHGFSDQLKSGSPAALTYNATLSKITGGATGLTTSLMLSGSHMSTFEGNVAAVGAAAKGGGSNINHWAEVQKNFNIQLGNAKLWLEGLILTIGGKLMPKVESAIGVMQKMVHWFGQNKWAAEALGGIIGTFLTMSVALWVKDMAKAAKGVVTDFIKMSKGAAKWALETGKSLVSATMSGAKWVASHAAQMAKWVAQNAVMIAKRIAATAVIIAQYVARAAAATAAFIAENAATLGIIAGIGLLIAGVIYLGTHWKQVWGDVKKIAGDAWHWLDNSVLHPAEHWFSGIITPVINTFKKLWDSVWDGIKKAVQTVWSVIGPIFDKIAGAIKTITGGISSIGKLGGGIIHGIGGAISKLAAGGIVNSPTLAIIGEAGPEAVVPMKFLTGSRPAPLGSMVGRGAAQNGGINVNPTYNVVITGTTEQIASQTRKMITDSHQQLVDLIETRIPG